MKKLFYIIMAAMMAFSCQKSDVEVTEQDKTPIHFSFQLGTKANDAGYENGDKVGIYVSYENSLSSFSNYVDNNEYTLQEGKWNTAKEIYWKDKTTPADFYCYYPYNGVGDALAHSFAVKSDQSVLANYKASDFLWGQKTDVAANTTNVVLSTKHILSNVLIYLTPGDGFTSEEFASAEKSVQIANVKTNSMINLGNGSVIDAGDMMTVTPYWNGEAYRAVLIPQTVNTSNDLLVIKINGVSYYASMNMTFLPETQHKLSIVVNKTNSGLNITIENWKMDDVIHNGEAR